MTKYQATFVVSKHVIYDFFSYLKEFRSLEFRHSSFTTLQKTGIENNKELIPKSGDEFLAIMFGFTTSFPNRC